jgi:hypothetical protein
MCPIIDDIFKMLHALLLVLSHKEEYWQIGMIPSMIENNEFVLYLESCATFSKAAMNKLSVILIQCDYSHDSLLSKFNYCALCLQ